MKQGMHHELELGFIIIQYLCAVNLSAVHTQRDGDWESSWAQGDFFFLLKKWQFQRHRHKPKICSGRAALNWNSSVLLVLLCSSAFPIPPNCLQWHFAILFSHSLIGFLDCLRRLLEFFFGMCCFCFSVKFIWLFWLVRWWCFFSPAIFTMSASKGILWVSGPGAFWAPFSDRMVQSNKFWMAMWPSQEN